MTGFDQARADLRLALDKIKALDEVFELVADFAEHLEKRGEHPVLTFDPDGRRIVLEIAVGRVPPQIFVGVEEAVPALERPRPKRASPVALKSGPWSEGEEERAIDLIGDGKSNKEIAAELGRTAIGIHFKLDPLRTALQEEDAREEVSADALIEADEPGTVAAVAPVPDEMPGPPDHLSLRERRVWEHLTAIADPAWPAERDLELVRLLCSGFGIEDVAARWDIESAALRARWNRLFPEKSIEAQKTMIAVLGARLEGAA